MSFMALRKTAVQFLGSTTIQLTKICQSFVHGMMFVNVPPSSRQPMVSLPHKEHLANKVSKVGVILEHGIKLFIGLLP